MQNIEDYVNKSTQHVGEIVLIFISDFVRNIYILKDGCLYEKYYLTKSKSLGQKVDLSFHFTDEIILHWAR